MRAVARALGRPTLSRADFMLRSGVASAVLHRLFPSWKAAIAAAGLLPQRPITTGDAVLLRELQHICERLGRFPNLAEYQRKSGRKPSVIRKRFGYWWQMPQHLLEYLEKHDPESPAADMARREVAALQNALSGRLRRSPGVYRRPVQVMPPVWEQRAGLRYGPPLDCPGLRHEPTTELGVVFLFGMVCERLGFAVDAIHNHFPDCEAKRLVDKRLNLWEPVRIEFELRSSNFRTQGHRPDQCDIIVCWEHNWPECPLEVIALKDLVVRKDSVVQRSHDTPAAPHQHPPQERLARELL